MAKPSLKLVPPTSINGTVPPRRRPNAELRPREYLTEAEVGRLMKAAGKNRNGHRDAAMVLLAFRHGLRAAEVVPPKRAKSFGVAAVAEADVTAAGLRIAQNVARCVAVAEDRKTAPGKGLPAGLAPAGSGI